MPKPITLKEVVGKNWIDFSSLKRLQTCPRQYFWGSIQNVTTVGEKTALINGSAYHDGKEAFYQAKLDGHSHEDACKIGKDAVIPTMKAIVTDHDSHNLETALAVMDVYYERWKNDHYKTLMLEVPFAIDFGDFVFVGRIDRVAESSALGIVIEETKSTSIVGEKWARRVKPNLQIDSYCAAYTILTGERPYGGTLDVIPVPRATYAKKNPKTAAQRATEPGFEPFRVGPGPRSEEDIENWIQTVAQWWNTLALYKRTEYFPQNTEHCVPLLGYECEFGLLCKLFPNPEKGVIDLPEEYKIDEWAPFPELLEKK